MQIAIFLYLCTGPNKFEFCFYLLTCEKTCHNNFILVVRKKKIHTVKKKNKQQYLLNVLMVLQQLPLRASLLYFMSQFLIVIKLALLEHGLQTRWSADVPSIPIHVILWSFSQENSGEPTWITSPVLSSWVLQFALSRIESWFHWRENPLLWLSFYRDISDTFLSSV